MAIVSEEWRDSNIAPGYQVSISGNVRRAFLLPHSRKHATTKLATNPDKNGFLFVSVKIDNGITKRLSVKKLVYSAFGPHPLTDQHWIRHKDGDKTNCHVSNLEAYIPTIMVDLTGSTFGHWTVLHRVGDSCRHRRWMCRCVCGTEKEIGAISLRHGTSHSCGCKKRERLVQKVGAEKHYSWKGGFKNPGSIAWCKARLSSLRTGQRRNGGAEIISKPIDVQRLWLKACGRCSSCQRETNRLHLDHDHATGIVRGFLCNTCNVALGMVGDCPNRLRRLAKYVEKCGKKLA